LAFNGKDFIKNLNGPLGRSVDSLALWMHVVTTEEYYEGFHDPYIKLIPFDCKLYRRVESVKQGLRIGYFEHLELIECSPACARALRETVSFLKSEGHEVIEIKIPHENEVIFTMFA
jgi:Asp-tRNA(Asn)/Glu-tRNA(Gln) amidotransferase A subunit family amidase